MQAYPSPGEYVAFSLNVAQTLITRVEGGQKNYRVVHPEVYNLGGITAIHGLVHDRQRRDLILVGRYDSDRQPLTLDDFAVALRARFVHGKWPLLSIDPTEQTQAAGMQTVRTEGGIEDTQFGADLFDADYRLKRIGMGLLSAAVPGLKTYWDLGEERAKQGQGGSQKIGSRFWFYPVLPNVSVREDVVAVQGLKVGVFTEVLSAEIDGKKIEDLSTFQDAAGDRFAREVSENFDRLAKRHVSLSRMQGLDELVALTRALEEMEERPDLTFWLKDYQVKPVKTPRRVKVLKRQEQYTLPAAGGYYQGSREASGGVQLMAIALRLKAGEVTALKEAVLTTRPKPDALSWNFVVGEWLIPTSRGMLRIEDIVPLFTQAVFLLEKKYWDDAITLYGKLVELKPDWDWVFIDRGVAYSEKGDHDRAIADFNQALAINPRLAEAYTNRGAAYADKGDPDRALTDYNQALAINPRDWKAYNNRGAAYADKGDPDRALADFNQTLAINPRFAEVYSNRGIVYTEKGNHDRAIADFNQALEINPRFAKAYHKRGFAYHGKGELERAIADYNQALAINPGDADVYHTRGVAYSHKNDPDRAIADFNQALAIDPGDALYYYHRGRSYGDKAEYDRAIADFNRALAINPRLEEAYVKRAAVYGIKEDYDRAIADYNQALAINPRVAETYIKRGTAYGLKGDYDRAIVDYNEALAINPRNAGAYFYKALASDRLGRFTEAIEAYQRFIEYAPPQYAPHNHIEVARERIRELEK